MIKGFQPACNQGVIEQRVGRYLIWPNFQSSLGGQQLHIIKTHFNLNSYGVPLISYNFLNPAIETSKKSLSIIIHYFSAYLSLWTDFVNFNAFYIICVKNAKIKVTKEISAT